MKKIACLLLTVLLLCGSMPNIAALNETLTEKIGAAAAGAVVVLEADTDEAVVIDKNITLDLNGFSVLGAVTVADGCTLTVKDSATDDFTVADAEGYGKLEAVAGTVKAAGGYLEIREADGISFHKVELQLTTVTLRPETVGIYYTGEFRGDQVVAANVDAFGIALRLKKAPDADYMRLSSACSRYYDFVAGTEGNTATGTLLKNVMRKGRPAAENKSNSQTKIYGAPYIRTNDGQYHFGTAVNYSLMQVTREADKQWDKLDETQKNAVMKMYNSFESIISTWYLPNINDTDIDIPI